MSIKVLHGTGTPRLVIGAQTIDLPYCGALIETFTPDALNEKKLFSGLKKNKILGYYYSASLDYSNYADADLLAKFQDIFDAARTEPFTFIPRSDNPAVFYLCEIDTDSALTWLQNRKHQGYKYVAVNIKGVERLTKIDLTTLAV